MTALDRDPYLELPLDGLRLVEASAGTGKTFTLATLVTRLVVERGLRIGQVLAVTYTEAATQELRARVRERLARAAGLSAGRQADPGDATDTISARIIERHLAASDEAPAALARRLRQAALEIDLAAIHTIHGFCARVLREFALETGQPFDSPALAPADAGLREALAQDLWRGLAADPADADLLALLWPTPQALADDLRALLGRDRLLPEPSVAGEDPRPALAKAADALRAAWRQHAEALHAALEHALATSVLRRNSYQPDWLDGCWRGIEDWMRGGVDAPLEAPIERLTPDALLARTNKAGQGRTPQSPLCDAIAGFLEARGRHGAWQQARAIALLHRIRDQARARLAEAKRLQQLQTYDDMIDGVADALAGPDGDALAQALRARHAVALVDEFQDTDPRQWAIFRRVWGTPHDETPPALFLIGDPKQAIYGFRGGDVHAYLQARDDAEPAPPLDRNFRSRPALLRAIAALYENADAAGEAPFVDPRIRFHAAQPGGRREDADYACSGVPAPALTVRRIDHDPDAGNAAGPFDAQRSRELATRACAADIHALLSDARAGRALIDGRAVEPGDIAVLVRKHSEAMRIQQALAAAGIPAVAAGRQSVFATDEAAELRALFEALLQPGDDGRLRAALATMLVGLDAVALAALDDDGPVHAQWQREAQGWRERWRRAGPLALVSDLCAAAGERLLGLHDGERRLGNYLQLAELMQEAQARAPGLHAQLDWLRGSIAGEDPDDEAQLLRLESDARRVQVVTLHKSKGLEYPLVFLPFAGIGSKARPPQRHCTFHDSRVHDGHARVLQWTLDREEPAWKHACAAHAWEQRAEDARLLYVGLTRARHAVWLVAGAFYNAAQTPLAPMLSDLASLHAHPDIAIAEGVPPAPPPLSPESEAPAPPARVAARQVSGDWWVHSFTQLAHADSGDVPTAVLADERGAEDEPSLTAADAGATPLAGEAAWDRAVDRRFGGTRFGNVLHAAFERCDFGRWREWRDGDDAPLGERAGLQLALSAGGYAGDELDDGMQLLTGLVGHSLTVPLPEGARLCDLPGDERRAELEFHLSLRPTGVDALLSLLHAHGVVTQRNAFGSRRRLEGMLTGKIDLTYVTGGRWYLLDYKSNQLQDYGPDTLARAMRESEYELQALLYTVALHRWLRFRIGSRYDYERDFGGVRYLFCRGLAAGGGNGVHGYRPPPPLVEALDALFAGREAIVARSGGGAA
jgi:exodeoxyribonuclease V beta subunit